jgi:hypothetical protein
MYTFIIPKGTTRAKKIAAFLSSNLAELRDAGIRNQIAARIIS